jgi:hypothetical protein
MLLNHMVDHRPNARGRQPARRGLAVHAPNSRPARSFRPRGERLDGACSRSRALCRPEPRCAGASLSPSRDAQKSVQIVSGACSASRGGLCHSLAPIEPRFTTPTIRAKRSTTAARRRKTAARVPKPPTVMRTSACTTSTANHGSARSGPDRPLATFALRRPPSPES